MPAEPTKAKLKRRSSRKDLEEYRFDGSHGRELELKRNRGEVSCAECRRLKIKCDKQIPCQSCQRRGCASLCPNGSLATGQGTRFVLAATEHLHRRISKLSGRIRQLEDALATLQAKVSTEVHPLLHEDMMVSDERDDGEGAADETAGPPPQNAEVLDAFGTLSISEHGVSRFFGPTGGSESLLLANLGSNHASPELTESIAHSNSPSSIGELSLFSQSFPFSPIGQAADVQGLIESHLPSYERTLNLCETYFAQVSWIFHGVTRIQLFDDMLPVIFKMRAPPPEEAGYYSGPHDLALLFIILSIGALVSDEPSNDLGEHFHQISRAALSLQPVLEKPSIVTIQTLHLMSIYNAMSGSDLKNDTSMEMTWSLITLASHLSQTIGLHRDSARWGLKPKMVQRRCILFWDLFVADVWQSLNTGRPPSFSLAYIDCTFPQHEDKEGGFGAAFAIWQCKFAAECVADVTARTLTAEAPSYATIMELDKKVREFPLPEGMDAPTDDLGTSFQRCVLDHIRETVLMYIHRSFFAQAIIENPVNPLKSSYAPSFLAAYRASSTILKSVREQFSIWPNSCSRFWTMWTFAFSAAVVFGTVVTRGPRSPLAQSAMTELEQACILFKKAAAYSIRATKALPILEKLREKARHALASAQSDPASGNNEGLLWNIKQEDTEDELAIIAGRTRFVSAKRVAEPNPAFLQQRYDTTSTTSYSMPQTDQQIQQQTYDPRGQSVAKPYPHPAPMAMMGSSSSSSLQTGWSAYPTSETREHYMDTSNLQNRSPQDLSANVGSQDNLGPPTTYDPWSRGSHLPDVREPTLIHTPITPSPAVAHPSRVPQTEPLHHQGYQSQQYHPVEPQMSAPDVQPHLQYAAHYAQNRPTHAVPPQMHHQQIMSHERTTYAYPTYPEAGPSYVQHHPSDIDLAGLGLASRDSRLDERWSSFMADSGLLEDYRRG